MPDVHAMVGLAHMRYGSLMDLPWTEIVHAIVAWQAHRQRRGSPT
jgi:hypothetical protein